MLINEPIEWCSNMLANLIRGRSLASGEQRRHIDGKNIVETQVASRSPGVWAIGLSSVMDMELLSDEECHLVVDAALNLDAEYAKAAVVAGSGKALHRLPAQREAMVQAAKSMAEPENKVEAVVGLSRGMAHLSPEQCERLFEVARSASPNGRFDEHNIKALHALVTAEWPWSARWDRPHPPQPELNTQQIPSVRLTR